MQIGWVSTHSEAMRAWPACSTAATAAAGEREEEEKEEGQAKERGVVPAWPACCIGMDVQQMRRAGAGTYRPGEICGGHLHSGVAIHLLVQVTIVRDHVLAQPTEHTCRVM